MTEEQLQKGQDLQLRLKKLQKEQSKWERAERIESIEVYGGGGHYDHHYPLDFEFINFEDLKLLVLAKLQKEIAKVQEQFNTL